jgi:hypothetical protein
MAESSVAECSTKVDKGKGKALPPDTHPQWTTGDFELLSADGQRFFVPTHLLFGAR